MKSVRVTFRQIRGAQMHGRSIMRCNRLAQVAAVLALAFAGVARAEDMKVSLTAAGFEPAHLKAKVGDVLVFTNVSDGPRTVFSPTRGFGIDLGAQKPGEVRRYRLGQPGALLIEDALDIKKTLTVEVAR